jgi:hypothetical protein
MSRPHIPGMCLINARIGTEIACLHICDGTIRDVNSRPPPGATVVDLQGDRVLPGLINSHDHLALNTLPPHAGRRHYQHAREWVVEVDARRRIDVEFEATVSVPRDDRLFVGGIKNLLSGVTTVSHHDPLYPSLASSEFPVNVVDSYGWSHSLYVDGDDEVQASYRATPPEWPWIIHAAEGLNSAAAEEFDRLEALGCVRQNTLLVHGIALNASQRHKLERAGAGLVWCPSSNLTLFGKTAEVSALSAAGNVSLGTDSRLSGARDLLEELTVARDIGGFSPAALEAMVTTDAARLLRIADRGEIRAGMRADLTVLPAAGALGRVTRSDLRLVMVGGKPVYADTTLATALTPASGWSHVLVDTIPKILDRGIALRLVQTSVKEPGLEIAETNWRAA